MNRLWSRVERLDEWIGGLFLGVMTVIVAVGFVLRYALGQPLYWSNEAAGILFVWLLFLGASAGIRYDFHIGIDVLVGLAPPRARFFLALLADAAVFVALVMLFFLGVDLTLNTIRKSIALELPYWVINSAVPVGCALMLINLVIRTVKRVRLFRAGAPLVGGKPVVETGREG